MYPSSNNSNQGYKMDEHLRELLHIHRNKFSEIDVDRLLLPLQDNGFLTPEDLDVIRRSPGQKIHTLLDILPSKGSQAFRALCLALENTSPHLLTIMLLGASQRVPYYSAPRQGSVNAGLTSDSECEDKKSSASSTGGVDPGGGSNLRQQQISSSPQSQANLISPHDYNMEQSNVALLKAELKILTKDRDVLKKELKKVMRERDDAYGRRSGAQHIEQNSNYATLGKHGSSASASEKSLTSARDYEALKLQYEKSILDIQALRKENMELSRKCDNTLKDVEYYKKQERIVYSSLQNLRLQYDEVVAEKQKLEHEVTSLQTIMDDDRKEIADLRRQQQEAVTQEGSGEAINQLYSSTLRKYEGLKDEYDSLRKRYSDVASSHSNNISKLELTQEEVSRIKNQYEEILREKNCLTQQCTEAIRQWDTALREKNKLQEEIVKVREKNEEIVKEMNSHLIQRQNLSKELKRLQEERNAAMQEYTLVMSERDSVHKEMDKMQEELAIASKKIKAIEQSTKDGSLERESLELQLETLKREIMSSLHDRDKAIRECNELRERFGAKEDNNKDWEHPFKGYDSYKQEREMNMKEGSDLAPTSHEMYAKAQKERLENLDQANQEVDRLRKTVEKLQSELTEAKREADVSTRRRDWAFGERDKIVQERESIRAHCDKLRHERDRAVSELADALRESDDMMKQRNEASNELKELKEKLEAEQEKSAAARQMVAHINSRDSAIDTEMHEWDFEAIQMQAIHGKHVDNTSSCEDGQRMFDSNGEVIQLATLKAIGSSSLSGPLSSGSSGHNMTEEEKALSYKHYSSSPTKDNTRSGSKELGLWITRGIGPNHVLEEAGGRRLGSSERVVYTVTKPVEEKGSGSGAWGQIKNIVKPRRHSKERADGRSDSREKEDKKKLLMVNDQEKENDAIAELDSVIDSYHYKVSDNSNTGTTKRSKKKEKEKTGGTWPKYRRGTISLSDPNAGTFNTSQWRKERPPLSMFLPTSNCTSPTESDTKMYSSYQLKNTLPRMSNSPLSNRSRNFTLYKNLSSNNTNLAMPISMHDRFSPHLSNGMYSDPQRGVYPMQDIYGTLPLRCSSIEHKPDDSEKERGHHSSPDTSLDFSVRSGNVGKEELEYYAKKKCGKHPASDSESNFGLDSSSQPSSLPPIYMPRPSPLHHLGERLPSNSRFPHTHSGLYSPPNVPLRVPPLAPYSFTLQHPHNHPHSGGPSTQGFSSSHYSSPPLHIGSSHFLSPSRSGDSILSSPGPDRDPRDIRGYYENQISSSSPTSSMAGSLALTSGGGFYHTASPSIDHKGHHKVRTSHTHAIRGSSDEPPGSVFLPGPPTYHDYQRTIATMPRKKDDDRIRVPSNMINKNGTRMGYADRVCDLSGRDSPTPANYSAGSSSSIGQLKNPHFPMYEGSRKARNIDIQKGTEPLGIQIRCLEHGGVYVSSVSMNSLASEHGISIGDQLLEVCGINMRTAKKQMATTVLSQCGNSVTMLVQYNPEKYQQAESWESSSGGSNAMGSGSGSGSGTPTPRNSPKLPRVPPLHYADNEEEDDDGADLPPSTSSTLRAPLDTRDSIDISLPPSARSTLTRPATQHLLSVLKRQDTLSRRSSVSDNSIPPSDCNTNNNNSKAFTTEERRIHVEMKSQNLGIKMVGGNAHGIFIHSVSPESPSSKVDLRSGDRILQYNGVDLRFTTAEHAAFELAKPAEIVSMVVKWDFQTYSKIKDQPGDSFYIRAHFDKMEANDPTELRFCKNDILYVDNTMFQNKPGIWRAWRVDQDGHKTECGTIPSKDKVEEEFMSQKNLGDLPMDSGRRLSSSSRRSFFRRKKHSRSSSRDSKELASFSDASLNTYSEASSNLPDESLPLSYLRVERLDYLVQRPIVMAGPLCDLVCERLALDYPTVFTRCHPEIKYCSHDEIQNWVQKNLIVDYRRRGSHYEVTSVSKVKSLCDKSSHTILDINLNSVERLHRHNIYPIVLVLKFKHYKHIRDIGDAHYSSTERLSQKEAKEMFDITNKTEQEYKHIISSVITAGVNMTYLCTHVKSVVDKEQLKTVWVPAGSP